MPRWGMNLFKMISRKKPSEQALGHASPLRASAGTRWLPGRASRGQGEHSPAAGGRLVRPDPSLDIHGRCGILVDRLTASRPEVLVFLTGRGVESVPAGSHYPEAPGDGAQLDIPSQPQAALRVLVVEDDGDAADSMAELLRLYGHDVEVSATGRPRRGRRFLLLA